MRNVAGTAVCPPARFPDRVDLDQVWQERSARFRTGGDQVTVVARIDPARREELVATALAVVTRRVDDGLVIEATFQDARHAEWALWQRS